MSQRTHKAIGIFDSGVGGLTVQKALMARFPHESTVYLGDTARVPYGTKSGDVVTRYSLKNADFLVHQDIKLLVIACNTASSVAIPALRAKLSVPVIGVIEPGATAAVKATKTGKVGVIGTPGTVRSGAYDREIRKALPAAQVVSKSCPLFVPLAEEGWLSGEVPQRVAKTYLEPLTRLDGLDTLVLGCTHYPLLKTVIGEVMGPEVTLVDSAEATADAVGAVLVERGELSPPRAAHVDRRYFVTDVPEPFLAVAERFLGAPVSAAQQVDLSFG